MSYSNINSNNRHCAYVTANCGALLASFSLHLGLLLQHFLLFFLYAPRLSFTLLASILGRAGRGRERKEDEGEGERDLKKGNVNANRW